MKLVALAACCAVLVVGCGDVGGDDGPATTAPSTAAGQHHGGAEAGEDPVPELDPQRPARPELFPTAYEKCRASFEEAVRRVRDVDPAALDRTVSYQPADTSHGPGQATISVNLAQDLGKRVDGPSDGLVRCLLEETGAPGSVRAQVMNPASGSDVLTWSDEVRLVFIAEQDELTSATFYAFVDPSAG